MRDLKQEGREHVCVRWDCRDTKGFIFFRGMIDVIL